MKSLSRLGLNVETEERRQKVVPASLRACGTPIFTKPVLLSSSTKDIGARIECQEGN